MIKKNVKRFILNKVSHLPTTHYHTVNVEVKEGNLIVCGNNHAIKNGEVQDEGLRYNTKCTDLLINIMRTGSKIQEILDTHDHVFWRTGPKVHGRDVRIRLITE
jgi:hypothetical protein